MESIDSTFSSFIFSVVRIIFTAIEYTVPSVSAIISPIPGLPIPESPSNAFEQSIFAKLSTTEQQQQFQLSNAGARILLNNASAIPIVIIIATDHFVCCTTSIRRRLFPGFVNHCAAAHSWCTLVDHFNRFGWRRFTVTTTKSLHSIRFWLVDTTTIQQQWRSNPIVSATRNCLHHTKVVLQSTIAQQSCDQPRSLAAVLECERTGRHGQWLSTRRFSNFRTKCATTECRQQLQ